MELREITAEEQAVLKELRDEVLEGPLVTPRQLMFSYPEEFEPGVSNKLYNEIWTMCRSRGLLVWVSREEPNKGVIRFTVTVDRRAPDEHPE